MKARMIEVNVEFVIASLESRYEDVKELWGNEASAALWEQALRLIEDCGLACSSPSEYVDNYLINGEFVNRFNISKNDCNSYGIEFDLSEDDEIIINDGEWCQFCQDNALIYNDEYACLQF